MRGAGILHSARSVGGLVLATRFESPAEREELGRGDLANRPAADVGNDEIVEGPLCLFEGRGREALALHLEPLERDGTERIPAYFAQGRPAFHGKAVHGFAPCRSSARDAGRG